MNRLLLLFITAGLYSCSSGVQNKAAFVEHDKLFQYSTISALQGGLYDGEITIGELKKFGNFGIGTFNSLDGEMVAVENDFMQIKSDGKVYHVADSIKTPFAAVAFFKSDFDTTLANVKDYSELAAILDSILPSGNLFYAFILKGNFSTVKVRSVPKQQKPYPPLVEVTATQPVFDYSNIEGSLAGYRMPGFVNGINVPLYHLHFIDKDKIRGGHLLAFEKFSGSVSIDYKYEFSLKLPDSKEFAKMNLERDKDEINKVEK